MVEDSDIASRAERSVVTLVVAAVIGAISGVASAAFLVALERVTATRVAHPALLYGLPFAGLVVGFVYDRIGASVRAGNDLVIDTIHDGGPEVPLRMAPMVLAGTLVTHLFGGSAGREGTAVQMAASLADFVSHRLRLDARTRRALLTAGVAGGFGSVFGTPIAGAIFGLEFVVVGRLDTRSLGPALIASLVGDATTRALGVAHTPYPEAPFLALTPLVVAKWSLVAVCVALTATAFVELTHAIRARGKEWLPAAPVRMFVGGVLVVGLTLVVGTDTYLGLGVSTIVRAFSDPELPRYVFALKVLFTAITIGFGFLGGEVTPLFFVGAALGNTLGVVLDLPLPLAVGVGMASMFAAASNTPIALSIMAVEILGANAFPHVVLVSVVAFLLSGSKSIYTSQRRRTGVRPETSE